MSVPMLENKFEFKCSCFEQVKNRPETAIEIGFYCIFSQLLLTKSDWYVFNSNPQEVLSNASDNGIDIVFVGSGKRDTVCVF